MMFPGMGGWMMAASGIFLLLIIGLAVVAVVALLRPSRAGSSISRPSAKELLDQRYARGEIDDDEYDRRLSVLDSTEPTTRLGD